MKELKISRLENASRINKFLFFVGKVTGAQKFLREQPRSCLAKEEHAFVKLLPIIVILLHLKQFP